MAVTDVKMYKGGAATLKHLVVPIITAVGQAGVKCLAITPGYAFQIVSVKTYCLNKAGTVTADVKKGATSVLNAAAAFAAGVETAVALAADYTKTKGTAADTINIHYTTDGAGALTNGFVVVTIRPRPLNGES